MRLPNGRELNLTGDSEKNQQTLGEIKTSRRTLTNEQRRAEYLYLLQAQRNDARAQANAELLGSAQFQRACQLANIKPTRRQASKWRRKQGAAWTKRNG